MSDGLMSIEELREILEKGRDWMRIPVRGVPGLFIIRWPGRLDLPARHAESAKLSIEVNPEWAESDTISFPYVSGEDLESSRMEYIKRLEGLEYIIGKLLPDPRLETLLEAVEMVNSGRPVTSHQYPEELIGIAAERLIEILDRGEKFFRVPVRDMPGVFIVKFPADPESRSPEYLVVELNHIREDGTLAFGPGYSVCTRKGLRGIRAHILKELEKVEAHLKILTHPGIDRLMADLEEVNRRWEMNWTARALETGWKPS